MSFNRIERQVFLALGAVIALFLLGCDVSNDKGHTYLEIKADTAWSGFDTLRIAWKDPATGEVGTFFYGPLQDFGASRKVPADFYHGQEIEVTIIGIRREKRVYEEVLDYNGAENRVLGSKQLVSQNTVLKPDSVDLKLGVRDSLDLPKVGVTPENLFDKSLTWSTSENSVFIVEGGRVVAKGEGTAMLKATLKSDPSLSVSFPVTVVAYKDSVTGVKFRLDAMTLYAGGSGVALQVDVTPPGANPGLELWLSDSTKAKVEANVLSGLLPGPISVVAQSREKPAFKDTLAVTILPKPDTTKPAQHAPVAPAIAALVAEDGKVTVSWSPVSGATSYYLFYGEGGAVDTLSTRKKGVTSPDTVVNLKNGTLYGFALTAVNEAGESDLGPPQTATPQVPVPGAPVISGVIPGDGKATVSFAPVAGATAYTLYYAQGATVNKQGTKVEGVSSPREISGLSNCVKYSFAVTAATTGGESGLSNAVTATPKSAAPLIARHTVLLSLCLSDKAVFTVWTTGSGKLTYQWRKGGKDIPGATDSVFTISSVVAGDAGEYQCAVADACGRDTVSNAMPLIFTAPPTLTTNLAALTVQHPGNSLSLKVVAAGEPPLTYSWKKDGVLIGTAPNANTLNLSSILLGDNNAAYQCVVSNSCGGEVISNTATLKVVATTKVSLGRDHNLFLTADGTLWGVGRNDQGELGDGTTDSRRPAVQLMAGVKDMTAGTMVSYFLKTDGSVWATGYNQNGQLANGLSVNTSTPTRMLASAGVYLANVVKIESQGIHALILKTDGTVWETGGSGVHTSGLDITRLYPEQVKDSTGAAITDAVDIAAGSSHGLILRRDGSVWSFGNNYTGQLGNGTQDNRAYASQVQTGCKKISAGSATSYCLKTDGSLWGVGHNSFGQFGDGTTESHDAFVQIRTGVAEIAAGDAHFLFKKTDGTIWSHGANDYGQLCDGGNRDLYTPYQVPVQSVSSFTAGEHQTMILFSDGTLAGAGGGAINQRNLTQITY